MLIEIYNLINRLQSEIGNDAEVRLSAREEILEVRVDWWDKDFHATRQFSVTELSEVVDDESLMKNLVEWCRNGYANARQAESPFVYSGMLHLAPTSRGSGVV